MRKKLNTKPALIPCNVVLLGNSRLVLSKTDIKKALDRISSCDWGEVDNAVWIENDLAYKSGNNISSVYTSENGYKFMVVTDPNRKSSVFLQENYIKRAC